jgi:hypothetical protein
MEIDDGAPELVTTPHSRPGISLPYSATVDPPAPKKGTSQQTRKKVAARQPPPSPDPPAGKGKGRAAPDPQSDDEIKIPAVENPSVMLPNFDGGDDDEYLDAKA